MPAASRFLTSGLIMRSTTAISSPTAAQEMPAACAAARRSRRSGRTAPPSMVDDQHRRADQAGEGGYPAGNAAKARAEHHREIDDIGTGQEVAERKGLVEFVRRHPAVLFDDAAPRPDQHAAEAGQRHLGERDKQLGQAGRRGGTLGTGSGTGRPEANSRHGENLERRSASREPVGAFHAPKAWFSGTVFLNLCPLY